MVYTVHGILQARTLEWVTFPFSRGSSQPREQTQVSRIVADSLPAELQGKPKNTGVGSHSLLQGCPQPRDPTWISCTAGRFFTRFFTIWATKKVPGYTGLTLKLKLRNRDFPGGPGVKNLPCNAGDAGPTRLGTNNPHALEQLKPSSSTRESLQQRFPHATTKTQCN